MTGALGPTHVPDAAKLADRFAERTGRRPEGVWGAPGRVNLIGEHLDYNDCHVLPLAVDRVAAVAVARRDDRLVRCWSLQDPTVAQSSVNELREASGWAAYLLGTLWALGEEGVEVPGLDIVLDSTVPAGSGMSSSAALECATALALAELTGAGLSRAELARACRRAENEVVGVPVGIMDQAASMEGREGEALFLDCRSGRIEPLPMTLEESGLALLVIDSGTRRRLAEGGYADRRDACHRAAARIGVPSLRDAALGDLDALADDPVLYRRARHVLSEEQRVLRSASLLRSGDLAAVGPLLVASHRSLRDDFEVSTPELDAVVGAALGAGALGARLTGGGFGGSAIALAPRRAIADIEAAVLEVFTAGHEAPSGRGEAGPETAGSHAPGPGPGQVHQPRVEEVRPSAGARRLA